MKSSKQHSPLKPSIEITKFTQLNFVFLNIIRVLPSCRQEAYFDSKRVAWAIIFWPFGKEKHGAHAAQG